MEDFRRQVKGSLYVSGQGDRERMAHPDDYCPEELLLPVDDDLRDPYEEDPDDPALLLCFDDRPVTRGEHELSLHTMVAPTEAPRHQLSDCVHKDHMSGPTREALKEICNEKQSCAAQSQFDVGTIKGYDFKIELQEDFKQVPGHDIGRPYRRNPTDQQIIKEQLDTLVKQGVIERSKDVGEWGSGVILVNKKSGEKRMCVDWRELNRRSKKAAYVIPHIEEQISRLAQYKYFTSVDLRAGYLHIPVSEECQHLTRFLTDWGAFTTKKMLFGYQNAPAHFQYVMESVFRELREMPGVLFAVYIDDLVIATKDEETHIAAVRKFLEICKRVDLKINAKKTTIGCQEFTFLGHIVQYGKKFPEDSYKAKLLNLPVPTDRKTLKAYLGCYEWISRFIPRLADLLEPMHALTRKGTLFEWEPKHQKRYEELQKIVSQIDYLHEPLGDGEFVIECDASEYAIGATLYQWQGRDATDEKSKDRVLRPIEHYARLFKDSEKNWHVSDKELFAIKRSIQRWNHYLYGRHFTVWSDHLNLVYLFNNPTKKRNPRWERWAVHLQGYNFTVKYLEGEKNIIADYLSRDGRKVLGLMAMVHSAIPMTKELLLTRRQERRMDSWNKGQGRLINAVQLRTFLMANYSPNNHLVVACCAQKTDEPFTANIPALDSAIFAEPLDEVADKQRVGHRGTGDDPREVLSRLERIVHATPELAAKELESQLQVERDRQLVPKRDPLALPENEEDQMELRHLFSSPKDKADYERDMYDTYGRSLWQQTKLVRFKRGLQCLFDTRMVVKEQKDDPWLDIVRKLALGRHGDRKALGKTVRMHVKNKRYYVDDNSDLLMWRASEEANAEGRVEIPRSLVVPVLHYFHTCAGHKGWKIMAQAIRKVCHWTGIDEMCRVFSRQCTHCQKYRHPIREKKQGKYRPIRAEGRFDMVSVDVVGPLPVTSAKYKYLLTVQDKFSRFVQVYPMRSISALDAAMTFMSNWVAHFGAPTKLLSDNGNCFIAEMAKVMSELWGYKHLFATAYYPQGNGAIERAHRDLKRFLAQRIADLEREDEMLDPIDWEAAARLWCFYKISTPHRAHGHTPSEVLFGENSKGTLDLVQGLQMVIRRGQNDRQHERMPAFVENLKLT
ncbi:MAG: DDE-type integrase/transposase/recombinase, partial [Desulfobacteraceae bacterium]|nr:DDE-type integrase/transposase/recombinase [Desulfobacteraceae bacterium]